MPNKNNLPKSTHNQSTKNLPKELASSESNNLEALAPVDENKKYFDIAYLKEYFGDYWFEEYFIR